MSSSIEGPYPAQHNTPGSGRAVREPGRLEHLYAIFSLFVVAGALRSFFTSGGLGHYEEGSIDRLVLLTALYLTAGLLLFIHHRDEFLHALGRNKLLMVLLAYVLLSSIWAVDSTISMRRSVALALSTIFCFYLALRYPIERILEMALVAVVLMVALNLGVAMLEGQGFQGARLRGFVNSATWLGRFAALGVLLVVALRNQHWLFQRYDLLVLLLLLLCLVGTDAVTPTLSIIIAIPSLILVWRVESSPGEISVRLAIAMMLGLPLLAIVQTYSADILQFFGRDPSLTDRTYIWAAALEKGPPNDWLGAGYRTFWLWSYSQDVSYNTFGSARTNLGNGHSGYIDTWLELGWIGVMIVGALFIQMFVRSIRAATKKLTPSAAFFPALLVYVVVYSVAEKIILEHSELTWMLFTTGLICLDWRRRNPEVSDHAPSSASASASVRTL